MGCWRLRGPGLAEAALEELVKAGHGTWRDVPTTAKGGRPARAFVLHQHINTSTKPFGGGTPHQRNPQNHWEHVGFVDVDAVDVPLNEVRVDAVADNPSPGLGHPGARPAGVSSAGDVGDDDATAFPFGANVVPGPDLL